MHVYIEISPDFAEGCERFLSRFIPHFLSLMKSQRKLRLLLVWLFTLDKRCTHQATRLPLKWNTKERIKKTRMKWAFHGLIPICASMHDGIKQFWTSFHKWPVLAITTGNLKKTISVFIYLSSKRQINENVCKIRLGLFKKSRWSSKQTRSFGFV